MLLKQARYIAVTSYPCTSRVVEPHADAEIVAIAVTRALLSFFLKNNFSEAQFQVLFFLPKLCNGEQLQEELCKFKATFEKLWELVVLNDIEV